MRSSRTSAVLSILGAGFSAALSAGSAHLIRSALGASRAEGWDLALPKRPKGFKNRPHGARKADMRAAAKRRRVKAHRARSRG